MRRRAINDRRVSVIDSPPIVGRRSGERSTPDDESRMNPLDPVFARELAAAHIDDPPTAGMPSLRAELCHCV
jgi:hypothetical protein